LPPNRDHVKNTSEVSARARVEMQPPEWFAS